jgi:hypothetical protein
VFKRIFGIGSEEIGRFAIPGEAELELPAGKVKLRYEQQRATNQKAPVGLPELELSITPAAGGEALVVKPPMGSSGGSGGGVQKMPVGTVGVPAAARYRVAVANSVDRTEPVLIVLA